MAFSFGQNFYFQFQIPEKHTIKSVPIIWTRLFLIWKKKQRLKLTYYNTQEFTEFQEQNRSDKFTYFT